MATKIEILLLKQTRDNDLKEGLKVCYKDINGIFSKLGTITDIIEIDGVKNYLLNTSFGSYHADELKIIKESVYPHEKLSFNEFQKKLFAHYDKNHKWSSKPRAHVVGTLYDEYLKGSKPSFLN